VQNNQTKIHNCKQILNKKVAPVYVTLGIFFVLMLFASDRVSAILYQPGETLNPACAPTDVNCGVIPPASSGVNTDITELDGLTTPLSVSQGGTGTSTFSIGDILFATGATELSRLPIGFDGQVLKVSGGVLTWGTDEVGGGGHTAGDGLELNGNEFSIKLDGGTLSVSGDGLKVSDTYLSAFDTDDLTEGTTNLYYTDTRARNALSSTAPGLTYTTSTGVFSLHGDYLIPLTASTTDWQTAFSWGDHSIAGYLTSFTETDPVFMAASSSFFTLAQWYATTTDALDEGVVNQYFTTARARGAISSSATGLSYDDNSGIFTLTTGYTIPLTNSTTDWQTAFSWGDHSGEGYLTNIAGFDTDDLTEGTTNLYYTDTRARNALSSTATGLTYTTSTGVFSLHGDYLIPLTASTTDWQTAFAWGDHGGAGYLVAANNLSDLTNSTTARTNLGLGGLAVLNSIDISDHTNLAVTVNGLELSDDTIVLSTGYVIPLTNSTTDWQTAFSWGDHSGAGYFDTAGVGIATSGTSISLDIDGLAEGVTFESGDFIAFYDTSAGQIRKVNYDQLPGAGGGITSLNGLTNPTQTFATSSDTNIGITVNSAGSTHTFTPTWTGILAVTRGGTGADNAGDARDNLGLGTVAVLNSIDISDHTNLAVTVNGLELSDDTIVLSTGYVIPLTNSTTDWQTAFAWGDHGGAGYLVAANNLSDLMNSSTARTNLGLGGLAVLNDLSTFDTDDLTEGTTNQYFTNARARSAISSSATGLSYDSGTGIFSLHGDYLIPLTASTTDWQTAFAWGDHGGAGYLVAANNLSDLTNSTTARTNLGLGGLAVLNDLSTFDTDDLTEGTTNLYYTDTRARDALSSTATGLTYTTSTGVFSLHGDYLIPLTASTTDWQTAFAWGDHGGAGYLVAANNLSDLTNSTTARTNLGLGTIATQNANNVAITGGTLDGVTIGAGTPGTAMFTNATSTNIAFTSGLSTPFTPGSIPFIGTGGLLTDNNNQLFWNNTHGQLGINTSTFTATNRGLEVVGRSELRDQLHVGRDITGTGWQSYISGWFLGAYRDFVMINHTTGRVGYLAGGGTQGHEIITVARPTRFNARSTTNNAQFTSATDSISYHLFGEAEFNNASAVYTAFRYNFIDTASSVDSKFFDMRLDNATQFVVRKDGHMGIGTSTLHGALTLNASTVASGGISFGGDTDLYRSGAGVLTLSGDMDVRGRNITQTATAENNPVILGGLTSGFDGPISIEVAGQYAYVLNFNTSSLSVVDISVPSSPVIVGSVASSTLMDGGFAVRVAGKYAYVASEDSNSLTVIDVSNHADPVIVGYLEDSTDLSGALALYLYGQYAYVAASGGDALTVVDIANPVRPEIAGTLVSSTAFNGINSVYASGRYVYTASTQANAVHVVDIADPVNPVIVGGVASTTALASPFEIYVSGVYAYVTSEFSNSLTVINVSDPTNPTIVGYLQDNTNLDEAWRVVVNGKYAYVASFGASSLQVIDVSDPTNPVIVSGITDATNLNGASSLAISGKYAYVGSYMNDGFHIIDLTGIDAPTANIGALQSSNISVTENITIGNDAYIGNGLVVGSGGILSQGGLSVSGGDIRQTGGSFVQTVGSDPVLLNSFTSSSIFSGTAKTYISGNYLYSINSFENALHIIDIADVNNPQVVGSLVDNTNMDQPRGVHVVGGYAYVVSFGGLEAPSFVVIDVSNPTTPTIVGLEADYSDFGGATSMYVSGKYAYVSAADIQSLTIVDISNPFDPVVAGKFTSSTVLSSVQDVYVSGNYAYTANRNNDSIAIIDISDPENPLFVNMLSHADLGGARSIYVAGGYAYVTASFDHSLRIVDVRDPLSLSIVGGIKDDVKLNTISSVVVSGKYAYVANAESDHAFAVIDISNKTQPVFVASAQDSILSEINYVRISGKNAYTTGLFNNSLHIIDLTGIDAPTANIGALQSSNISVTDNLIIGNDTYIGNGLVVGSGGILSYGGFSFSNPSSTSYIAGSLVFGLSSLALQDDVILQLPNDASSTAMGHTWDTYSDTRIKLDQTSLGYGLSEILQLQPKRYTQKNSYWDNGELILSGGNNTFGLIAQEVYDILPEIVSRPSDESRGLWGIDYSKLGPVLVRAIQEQQDQIDGLHFYLAGISTSSPTTLSEEELLFASNKPLTSALTYLSNRLASGATILKDFMAERITAVVGVFHRVKTGVVEVDTGIQIRDQGTGEWYCMTLVYGEWQTVSGQCTYTEQSWDNSQSTSDASGTTSYTSDDSNIVVEESEVLDEDVSVDDVEIDEIKIEEDGEKDIEDDEEVDEENE